MVEETAEKPAFRGWVNTVLGAAILLKQAPVIWDLIQAMLYYNLVGTEALAGRIYNGWFVTQGALSIFSGWALRTHHRRAPVYTAIAGGTILMSAGYHLIRFGPGWLEFIHEDGDRRRFLFAVSQCGLDLVLGLWWVYCLWTVLIRRPATEPEGRTPDRRHLWLSTAAAAVFSSLTTHAIYLWAPVA